MAVVVVKSIGNAVPKDFAVQTFNHWGIGKKGKDNGLLILLVMNQRRIEFEVGYGLEGVLTDFLCGKIIRETMTPLMKSGAYAEAINGALDDIEIILGAGVEMPNSATSATNVDRWFLGTISDLNQIIQPFFSLLIIATFYLFPFWLAFKLKKSKLLNKNAGTPATKDLKGLSREEFVIAVSALASNFKNKETILPSTHVQNEGITSATPETKDKKRFGFYFTRLWFPALVFCAFIMVFFDDINAFATATIFSLAYLIGNFGFFVFFQKKSQDLTMKYVVGKSKDFPLGKISRWLLFPVSLFILSLRFFTYLKRRLMTKEGLSMLKEEDEDRYLTPSQITEEKIGSVEYDVFVHPKDQIVSVEKNVLPFGKYKKCDKCSTLSEYVEKDVVISEASESSSCHGYKYYHCLHCSCRRKVSYTIPQIQSSSGSSSSSGGSSSGGGSFGGGRSGGGGAGGSW